MTPARRAQAIQLREWLILHGTEPQHLELVYLLGELLEDAAQQGWQPISTAPKDGTRVLLHPGHGGYGVVGRHSLTNRCWESLPGKYTMNPTHWMPLHDPPQALGAGPETAR